MSVSERTEATYARTRIDRLVGRVFSLGALATTIETLVNATYQAKSFNSTILYASIGLILVAQVYAVFSFWLGSAHRRAYVFHGVAYLVGFALYPFAVLPESVFAEGFRPWLWWATGPAMMAMGMYLPKWWSAGYLVLVPCSWFALRQTPIGGSGSLGIAILDAVYVILYSAAILSLVLLLRAAALRLDNKNYETADLVVQRAVQEATEFERQRLDDLVHDSVLTTLLLAAKSSSKDQQSLAAQSARDAAARIQKAYSDPLTETKDVSVGAFFEALRVSIERGFDGCEVHLSTSSDFQIPANVGLALSEATIQALTNSAQHAGRRAVREVRLKADQHGLKIVIKDNGRGFWVSKVPKDRFGLRHSIHRRMERVDGFAKIDSAPRKGTTVILRWAPNA